MIIDLILQVWGFWIDKFNTLNLVQGHIGAYASVLRPFTQFGSWFLGSGLMTAFIASVAVWVGGRFLIAVVMFIYSNIPVLGGKG